MLCQWSEPINCPSGTLVIVANNIEMTLLVGITTSTARGATEYHCTLYQYHLLYGGQSCSGYEAHEVIGLAIGY